MAVPGLARVRLAAAVMALSGAIAGATACASGAGHGMVTGRILYSGGPAGQGDRTTAEPGRVTIRNRSDIVATQTVVRGQRFRIRIRAGSYRVSAHSGDARCGSVRVHIRAGHATDVDITCSVR